MKLAANLNSLWSNLPYADRFEAAAGAGFRAVTVPLPYDASAKETQRAASRAGIPVVQISMPPPNYTGGARGFAALPGLEARFRYDLRRALRYCALLGVDSLHIMAGQAEGPSARATLLSNLRHAISCLPDKLTLTLQPQAQKDAFLNDFTLAAEIIEQVGSDRLGLQFHSHHAALLHGDAAMVFEAHKSVIRHLQIGDAPGTGVPGTGAIDFGALFDRVQAAGYDGWVVADYAARAATDDSLDWMADILARPALVGDRPVGTGAHVHG